jgi:hypothetical protein
MQYTAHYFLNLNDSLRSMHSVNVPGETVEDAREQAITLLPGIRGAIGFRLCDRTDRQVDIYVPPHSVP